MEEEYWKAKSGMHWLKAGDKNTRYFHEKTKERRSKNKITLLEDDCGQVFMEPSDIQRIATTYFQNLYNSNHPSFSVTQLAGIPKSVTSIINMDLNRPVSEEEIKQDLFSINSEKSPGPDGMNSGFFRQHWDIIRSGVCNYIKLFFEEDFLEPELNKTNICLLPKNDSPVHLKDFRPISLSNVAYKIIAKILANIVKPWLKDIISEYQTAFIPGRCITDNILIDHELLHSLRTKKLAHDYMAIKLDISKAFDKVEWLFLNAIMEQMGFHQKWRCWIMKCISTVTYSILINGVPTWQVIPQRGIRQGDPISPYLYLLCTQGLSALLHTLCSFNKLRGYKLLDEDLK